MMMIFLFEFDDVLLYGYSEHVSARLHAAEIHRGKRARRAFYLRSQGKLQQYMLRQLARHSSGGGTLNCGFEGAKQLLLDCLYVPA